MPAPTVEGSERRSAPPVLAWLEAQGVQLTALGEAGGLSGYLAESPDGRLQVLYVTPDGRHVVAGLLFREGGANVTASQLAAMRERFEAERRRLSEQDRRVAAAHRSADGGFDKAPSLARLTEAEGRKTADAPSQARPVEAAERAALRDRLLREAEATAWFSVGRSGAPVVWLVADPQCPHCHAAWAQLKPKVEAGEVTVRVILVGALPGSEERAISLLARPEPGRLWMAGEGSTPARVAPPPPETSRQHQIARQLLRTNLAFAQANGIRGTPWLAHVAADGELRIMEGAGDIAAFLAPLLRR